MMEKFKVVSVGCGTIANEWMKNALSTDGYGNRRAGRHKERISRCNGRALWIICPTYTDIAAAIEDTQADVVFDLTIPASHFGVCTTALKLGCNVFSEKPISATMAEAREMIQAAEESGNRFPLCKIADTIPIFAHIAVLYNRARLASRDISVPISLLAPILTGFAP